ncbi:DUF4296 domain-containing protein [Maribacter sp. 2-571]|uniref:DUF4296 domain-containing protein n=1 Tax=Maribacter sp. 2-571 TaxID=3417569 RepID=UPI003D3450A7
MTELKNIWAIGCSITMLLFQACGEKAIEPPERLIAKDKMITVLTDLTLLNAAKVTNISVLEENGVEPMAYLFQKHDIDSLQFVESNRYYASLPLVYEDIYVQIKKRIESQQETILAAKKEKDSIKLIEREANKKRKKKKTDTVKGSEAKKAAIKNALQ